MLLERVRFERELERLNPPARGQQGARAPTSFPVVKATNRTIFIVDRAPFKTLPDKVKTAAIDELRTLFDFVGRTGAKIKVVLADEANFPQSFAFSDAVVGTVDSSAALEANMHDSFRLQGQNAVASLRKLNVNFANPFANTGKTALKLDRAGVGRKDKRITGGRAIPFQAAYVAMEEIMSDFVDLADSKIQVARVRKRRADPQLNPRYWASSRALLDTAVISVLDNPRDPTKWLWQPELFGQLIGRTIAHEVRHTYVGGGHAADGLGADGARVEEARYATFSAADRTMIARAIAADERRQGSLAVVPTNPPGQPFPF